ncbi:SPOR domain-containing protein [uncultured Vibrio sp.]|uniref:SPOR domain-containing protein n=1 Tax=uncultured Vibrio sp. TaxID=114054 RepID=UPI00261D3C99|nr:SPOR domain-containing protein [uncultured Vibrio sp.]
MDKQLAVLAVSAFCIFYTCSVSAQQNAIHMFLDENCRVSTQPDNLPILASSCPIGRALYQGISPNINLDGFYWAQCGANVEPFSSSPLLKKLTSVTHSQLVQSYDGEYYRCLTGPYRKYEDAKKVAHYASKLLKVDAFIRESQLVKQSSSTFTNNQSNEPKSKVIPNNGAVIMNRTVIGELSYFIPVFHDNSFSFFNENDKRWNRFTYQNALSTCKSLNAELIKGDDFEQLIQHESVETWPKTLPYWVEGGYVRNFEGKQYSSTKNSKLYLMCRQSRER